MGAKGLTNDAPALSVEFWIDAEGKRRPPLRLEELGSAYTILFCFQHWCPGCHLSGFPTLQRLVHKFADGPHGFAAIQTVFEGEDQNTPDRLRENQFRCGLEIPFGHDPPTFPSRYPSLMRDYQTNGTPWFIVIDPQHRIVFSDFHLDAEQAIESLCRHGAPIR